QKFFRDFVTFNNYIGFIVAREYLDNVTKLAYSDEAKIHNFYKFLLKLLQGDDALIIPCLTDPLCMSEVLSHLVLERIETLRKIDYVVEYVHRSCIKKAFSRGAEELDDLKSVALHQDSLVGQFLRKFAIGFHLQPFEQVTKFCNSFYAYYDSVRTREKLLSVSLSSYLSSNQVITFSEEIITKAGRLGSLSSSEFDSLVKKLQSYQRNYPDLATPRFASHAVAMRQRNLSQAETNLFKAFEMAISWPPTDSSSAVAPEPRPVDAWTRMTLGAADMHHRFGHSPQARSFLHQALAQALETNDVLSLRHAKGLPAQAVQIIESAIETIGRFEEFAHFERARVETQLEQALRSGTDLSNCGRLINDLALFCPWEASLRRANLELKRGNHALAIDILQALADRAESLRTAIGVNDDDGLHSRNLCREASHEDTGRLSQVLEPPRAGGLAALVRFEVRARIAMAEILAFNGIFSEALNQLERAALLSRQYHMKTFVNICTIMVATISSIEELPEKSPLVNGMSIFETFTDICYQAEPAVVMHLTNMKLWLSLLAGYLNIEVTWKNQLREGAAFFANIGDKYSLQKLLDIFRITLSQGFSNIFSHYVDCSSACTLVDIFKALDSFNSLNSPTSEPLS
ncbi:Anaphase-promoting complex subunit 5, partial [Taenia solium]